MTYCQVILIINIQIILLLHFTVVVRALDWLSGGSSPDPNFSSIMFVGAFLYKEMPQTIQWQHSLHPLPDKALKPWDLYFKWMRLCLGSQEGLQQDLVIGIDRLLELDKAVQE